MTYVLLRRKEDSDLEREHHVKLEAEIGARHLQVKEHQRWLLSFPLSVQELEAISYSRVPFAQSSLIF